MTGARDAAGEGSPGGTYTLLVELSDKATIVVGALGLQTFDAGWYAYTGSAVGVGGFTRVERHRELATGEREARHWHVDYLLGHGATRIERVVTSAGVDAECAVHRRIVAVDGVEVAVQGFGASDCDCGAHLAFAESRETLETAVVEGHQGAG